VQIRIEGLAARHPAARPGAAAALQALDLSVEPGE